MRIIRHYLTREIYAASGLVLLGLALLFAFFDLIGEMDSLGQGDYRLPQLLAFVALSMPGHAYDLLPIAALIGTLYALAQLGLSSELTVIRASGMSNGRIMLILARAASPLAIVTLLVGEYVAPPAERAAQQLRARATTAVVAQQFQSGLWVKDGATFVNVREIRPQTEGYALRGVKIYNFDADYQLRSIRGAREASHSPEGWNLRGIVETYFDDEGIRVERAKEAQWRSVLTPEVLSTLLVHAERMSISALLAHARYLATQKQRSIEYEIATWKKILYPFANFVMVFLAYPFALGQNRAGGLGLRVFVGVMLGVLFHHLNSLFSFLGQLKHWPPPAVAALPSVLFLAAALCALVWRERR